MPPVRRAEAPSWFTFTDTVAWDDTAVRFIFSGVTFPHGLTNSVDLSPVFFDGAHADSRDGDKVCSFCGAPLSDGSQRLVTEDAERRYTPAPRFQQSPATQRLFDG